MIKDALGYLIGVGKDLIPVQQFDINGRKYTDTSLVELRDPQLTEVQVGTLQGLVDLVNAGLESLDPTKVLAHVVDYKNVKLVAKKSDDWARRLTLVNVQLPPHDGFKFGQWHEHEPFIIGVQSNFTEDADRDYVVKIASNITSEQVKTSNDDGISQQVGQKQGVALVGVETLRGRVKLAPFRTFREVAQPESEFVFRVKQSGDGKPALALFEADGGKWKIDAVETIARWLRVSLGEHAIDVVS